MLIVATLACLLGVQDLRLEPKDPCVGAVVTVTVLRDGAPVAGVEVSIEREGAAWLPLGRTGAEGSVGYTPEQPGPVAFAATVDGVRCVAPVVVAPARRRWLWALGSVPLGLALLWRHLRSAARASAARAPVRPGPDRRGP